MSKSLWIIYFKCKYLHRLISFFSSILVRGRFLAKRNLDLDFPEIHKNLVFKALFDQFGWNRKSSLSSKYSCRNRFLDFGFYFWIQHLVFRNPGKLVLTVYLHVIHHFSSFQHGEFILRLNMKLYRSVVLEEICLV